VRKLKPYRNPIFDFYIFGTFYGNLSFARMNVVIPMGGIGERFARVGAVSSFYALLRLAHPAAGRLPLSEAACEPGRPADDLLARVCDHDKSHCAKAVAGCSTTWRCLLTTACTSP
jgi:hypothetical protein